MDRCEFIQNNDFTQVSRYECIIKTFNLISYLSIKTNAEGTEKKRPNEHPRQSCLN